MKHSEEDIKEIAKKVMQDLEGKFYVENGIGQPRFDSEKEILSGKEMGNTHPVWIIGIDAMADNIDFLFISDETGEPLYYQNFNTFIFDIKQKSNGQYYLEGIE